MYNKIKYDASGFYDNISESYDEMFDFKKDLNSAESVIAELKKQFSFEKALDIGCGTGSFTIALARSGVKAVGMDLSSLMISEAKKNSLAYGVDIDFVNSGMGEMLSNINNKFDLIMCMGNTLPHLLSKKELFSMTIACRQLLNPGGRLVLNLLNYDKILSKKERIVGISKNDNHEFIRFYDFQEPYVNFNLLEIKWDKKTPLHKITSTKLYPYTHLEVESALMQAGFENLKVYNGLDFTRYEAEESKSILITAERK
jgi:glycine/sarcosine N-methyltransferase